MRRAFLTTTIVIAAIAFSANGFASGNGQPSTTPPPVSCNSAPVNSVANPAARPQSATVSAPAKSDAMQAPSVAPVAPACVQPQATAAPSATPPAQVMNQKPAQQPAAAPGRAEAKPALSHPTNMPAQTPSVPQAACPPQPSQAVSGPATSRPAAQSAVQPVTQAATNMRMTPAPAAKQSGQPVNVENESTRSTAGQAQDRTQINRSAAPAPTPAMSGAVVKKNATPVAPQRSSQGVVGQAAAPQPRAVSPTQYGKQCPSEDETMPTLVEDGLSEKAASPRRAPMSAAPASVTKEAPAATAIVPVDQRDTSQCESCRKRRQMTGQPPAVAPDPGRTLAPVKTTTAPQQAQPQRSQPSGAIGGAKPQSVRPQASSDIRTQSPKQAPQAARMPQPQTATPAVNATPVVSNAPATAPVAGIPARQPAQAQPAGANKKPAEAAAVLNAPAPTSTGVTHVAPASCNPPVKNSSATVGNSTGSQAGTWQQAPAGAGASGTAGAAQGNVRTEQPASPQAVNPACR